MVNVFLPTTPNPTSGFLLFIPKDESEITSDVEEGIKNINSSSFGYSEQKKIKTKKSK